MKLDYISPRAELRAFLQKSDICEWISDIFMDGTFSDYGDLSSDTDGDDV